MMNVKHGDVSVYINIYIYLPMTDIGLNTREISKLVVKKINYFIQVWMPERRHWNS